jgi:hypothetical protein
LVRQEAQVVGAADDPIPVALIVARALEHLGVPYLIGGSVASTIHGEPRGTLDVDFAAHLEAKDVEALVALLDPDFFVMPESVHEAVARQAQFNVIHRKLYLKIDVHVRPRSGHFAEEIRRARTVQLSKAGSARVATPEDTLLRKLWWYRLGDGASDQQWRDVLGILRVSGATLDRRYLEHWSTDLEVGDLLRKALREAGLGGR